MPLDRVDRNPAEFRDLQTFFFPENSTCFIEEYIEAISFKWNARQTNFEGFRAKSFLVRIGQHNTYSIQKLTSLIFLEILQHPQEKYLYETQNEDFY